jgi:3-hydroxyisobutyrate dehydrogenase
MTAIVDPSRDQCGSQGVNHSLDRCSSFTDTGTVTEQIGFIGLGNLGAHLATSLLRAGHQVTVNDLHRESAASLLGLGALWADSPAQVAAASDTVFTCLPSPAAVSAAVAGPGGVLDGLRAGGTWVDMSTNDRNETIRLAALAAQRGILVLEAPVTGGVHKAAAGEITVLVGGDRHVYEAHLPLLEAVGGPVLYMGPLGSAALIKVITNMLAFIHLVAAGEALMLAKQGGLDLGQAFEAIKNSSGNSFVHETESQVILNGSYNIGFTMDLACKDLGFATQFGRELGVPLDVAALVEQTFIRARAQFGGGAWSSQVVKLLEDSLGVDLRAPGFPEVLT